MKFNDKEYLQALKIAKFRIEEGEWSVTEVALLAAHEECQRMKEQVESSNLNGADMTFIRTLNENQQFRSRIDELENECESWKQLESNIPTRLTTKLSAFGNMTAFEFFYHLVTKLGHSIDEASLAVLGTLRRCETFSDEEMKLRSRIAELEQLIQAKDDELTFINSGCLVPPDGGSPTIQDAIDSAAKALALTPEVLRAKVQAQTKAIEAIKEIGRNIEFFCQNPHYVPKVVNGLISKLLKAIDELKECK